MAFAGTLASLTMTICALSCVLMTAEFLLPAGPLKNSLSVAAGILFVAAVIEQITGIFMGGGV
ncbi:MAG: hypothetical protein Q4C13_02345 [Clostridia bacterium]|nr:hypothetical protein [Clostridia bacterium]